MTRRSATAMAAAVAAVAVTALPGCFGGNNDGSSAALHARTTHTRLEATTQVERIVYFSSDGSRVPALFVRPRGTSPRGCLIWQSGLNSSKEDSAEIWQRAARLGLAVFSIDLRHHGERGSGPREVEKVVADTRRLAALVRGSVAELSRGVDYLERRRECRRNIGYVGLSLGGMIGSVLAGRDPRIRATVLASTAPTWRSLVVDGDPILPEVENGPARLQPLPSLLPAQRRAAQRMLAPLDPVRWITRISPRPVMVLIGREDPLVPPRAAAQLASATRPPKRIVKYRGSHAPFSGPDAERNTFLLEDFLLKWLVKPTYPL